MPRNEEIKVVIKADDKATKEIQGVGKSLDGFGINIGKLVASLGVVAGAWKVFDFGRDSVQAFMEAEKEMTLANKVLENSLNGLSDKALGKLTAQMQEGQDEFQFLQATMDEVGKSAIKLGFDDEAASVSFAKLFQVTNDVTQAQKDLQLAMDLSAFSGRDLESSVQAITMVHAGGTKVLKEFGIEVKEGTTAMQALSMVNDRVAGSSEEMALTTGKQLEILGLQWNNLKEEVGGALAEAITPFISELTTWASQPETQQKIQEIVTGIANFSKAVLQFVQEYWPTFKAVLQVMGEMIRIVWVSFQTLWGWLQAVMTMIDAVTNSIVKAVQWIDNLIDRLQRLAKELAKGVLNSVGKFGGVLTSPVNALMSTVTGKKQFGGYVGARQSYLVGENGPEIFTPAISGRVGSGGGGITINISGNTLLDEDSGRVIGDQIIRALKMNMRI